jgi:hypothetical protein
MPEITAENVEQIMPYVAPTAQEVQAMAPDLSNLSFEPIAQQARKEFQESTIPSIAERFAGGRRIKFICSYWSTRKSWIGFRKQISRFTFSIWT